MSGISGLDFEQVPARSFPLKILQFTNIVNGSQNRGNRKNGGKSKAIPLQGRKTLRVPRG